MTFAKKTTKSFLNLEFFINVLFGVFLELMPRLRRADSQKRDSGGNLNLGLNVPIESMKGISQTQSIVLLDSFVVPHWAVINTIAAREIAEKTGSTIATFNFTHRSYSENTLFNSLGINTHIRVKFTPIVFFKTLVIFSKLIKDFSSGKKVADLQFAQINIGLDVYESFLRRGNPTVNPYSRDLYRELWRAVKELLFFEPLFSKRRITALLVSHDSYVGPGLLARIAYKYQVPVILLNPFEINITNGNFQLYERFIRYRDYFASQTLRWRSEMFKASEIDLQKRISGVLGVGTMNYQVKSAFTSQLIASQIEDSPDRKIVVLCHDFFDNPHAYARMLFDDFIEWLTFIAETCEEESIQCYLKLHRDFSDIELQVVREFQEKYPFIKVLDPEVSYHQLFAEGIRFVTTCYGSAGHELPLLGFTVVNASYNPHVSYDFNHHAKSIDEYRKMLIDQVPITLNDSRKNQIYEFYAVHTFLMWPDSFNLRSFVDFDNRCGGDFTSSAALEWLEENFHDISERVTRNLTDAIRNRRRFSVETSLPKEKQDRIENQPPSKSFLSFFD